MSKEVRSATAQDVAKAAGVSQATVSYILNGRRSGALRISEQTRQRVLAAAAALEYIPNQTARNLRRRSIERICIVLPDFGIPSCDVLVHDVQRVAATHGYTVVVVMAGTSEREHEVLRQLLGGLADGGIFINPSALTGEDLASAASRCAITVMSNEISGPGIDVVRTVNADACHQAVSYLLDQGHRRIAFLGHCGDEAGRLERLSGYRDALAERGIAVDDRLVQGTGNSRERAYQSAHTVLAVDNPPTAIFAASDMGAISAIWAARTTGRRVPDDIAIIGVGNIPEGTITQPPLTTVGPDPLDFGFVGDLMFSRLAGDAPPEGRIINHPTTLILRGSA